MSPSRPIPFEGRGGRGPGMMRPAQPSKGGAPIVPPTGFSGVASQTAAAQATFRAPPQLSAAGIYANRTTRKRRRRRRSSPTLRRRRAARSAAPRKKRKRRARLVKGSAAAKRYMAKLRAMRKR